MSQKGADEYDFPYKRPQGVQQPNSSLIPPQQFLPPAATPAPVGAYGPQAGAMPPMPPASSYWDWWNYNYSAQLTNPSPFDMGYRDELNKSNYMQQYQHLQHPQQYQLGAVSSSSSSNNNNRLASSNNQKLKTQFASNNKLDSNDSKRSVVGEVLTGNDDLDDRLSTYSSHSVKTNSNHTWASRDSLNDINYQVFNQSFPAKNQSSNQKTQQSSNQAGSSQPQASGASVMPPPSMPQYVMPPAPFMDPATAAYMYYQMSSFAYPPMMNPTMYNPYGLPMMNMPPQRPMQDDTISIQSLRFDTDTRSERLNVNVNRPQSVAGGAYKTDLNETKSIINKNIGMNDKNTVGGGGLLIEDTINQTQANLGSNLEPVMEQLNNQSASAILNNAAQIKREENRMTPQLHQLAHVRACFSLNSLVQVRANDPCEGQPALVDVINLSDLMEHYLINLKVNESKAMTAASSTNMNDYLNDDDNLSSAGENVNELSAEIRKEVLNNYRILQEFPGPLVKEHTSKAQLIQFCQKNVKECLSNSNVNMIDPQSHALLWDYLALLVRQNGIVDLKTDISPLLLSGIGDTQNQWSLTATTTTTTTTTTTLTLSTLNKPASSSIPHSGSSSSLVALQHQQDFVLVNNNDAAATPSLPVTGTNENEQALSLKTEQQQPQQQQQVAIPTEEEIHLNKLRQLLGAGQKADAIELAIKYNMWPHAFFLASSFNSPLGNALVSASTNSLVNPLSTGASVSMNNPINESKSLNKVKVRFINSLLPHDPIHTCYQLLIGRVPTVASNVSKSEWNDWRRHLAMIVSNVDDNNKDLVLTTIKTMGDSLATNGRVAASHFCYLLSDCPFGVYNKKSSKIVLIGSSHNQDFSKFCQISAIQATEIYEFAHSLSTARNSSFASTLDHFVKYKLIYATRLLEYGLINEACKYIEVIAKSINNNPKLHAEKISTVYQLANRLRVYDSDFNVEDLSNPNSEPEWLQELTNNFKRQYLNKFMHLLPITNSVTNSQQSDMHQNQHHQQQFQQHESLITTVNVNQAKNEPLTVQSSPASTTYPDMNRLNLNTDHLNHPQQPHSGYPLQSQQSMPFYPQYNDDNNLTSAAEPYRTTSDINLNNQQGYLPQGISSRRYSVDNQNSLDQTNQLNLQSQQQQQQQQQPQSYYIPSANQGYQDQNISSRKSSVSSVNQINSSSGIYNPSHQSYNYSATSVQNLNQPSYNNQIGQKQRNLSTSAVTNMPPGDQSQFMNTQSQFIPSTSSKFTPTTRSRQSSSSTSYNDNVYNQYQPNQSIYDPNNLTNTRNISKSMTFPSSQTNPIINPTISNQIKEEPYTNDSNDSNDNDNYSSSSRANDEDYNAGSSNTNNYNDDEEDDEYSTTNRKSRTDKNANNDNKNNKLSQGQQQQQNQGSWFKKAFGYIIPQNTAKKMVLPDDKKKTIVWDDKLKRYVNKDSNEDPVAAIKPPPIFLPPAPQPAPTQPESNINSTTQPSTGEVPSQPPIMTGQNRFSLKSQNANKRNYYSKLDILADQSKKVPSQTDPQQVLGPLLSNMPPPSQIPPRFFVPEPQAAQQSQQQSNNPEDQQQQQQPQQQENQQYQQVEQPQEQQNYQQQAYNNYNPNEHDQADQSYAQQQQQQYAYGQQQDQYNYNNQYNQYSQEQNQYSQHHSNI